MKLDHLLTPYTRINSKWYNDLNVRLKTIKILEENIISAKSQILLIAIFYLVYLLRQEKQKKNKQMGLHQTKRFFTAKETINKTKRQCTEWATCSMIDTSDKGLISKMYKELIKTQHTHKKNPIPFKNRQRTWILLQRGQTDSQ